MDDAAHAAGICPSDGCASDEAADGVAVLDLQCGEVAEVYWSLKDFDVVAAVVVGDGPKLPPFEIGRLINGGSR